MDSSELRADITEIGKILGDYCLFASFLHCWNNKLFINKFKVVFYS